jgi:hypothetical protein
MMDSKTGLQAVAAVAADGRRADYGVPSAACHGVGRLPTVSVDNFVEKTWQRPAGSTPLLAMA